MRPAPCARGKEPRRARIDLGARRPYKRPKFRSRVAGRATPGGPAHAAGGYPAAGASRQQTEIAGETHLSTKRTGTQTAARLQGAQGDQGRPQGSLTAPRERAQAPLRLTPAHAGASEDGRRERGPGPFAQARGVSARSRRADVESIQPGSAGEGQRARRGRNRALRLYRDQTARRGGAAEQGEAAAEGGRQACRAGKRQGRV